MRCPCLKDQAALVRRARSAPVAVLALLVAAPGCHKPSASPSAPTYLSSSDYNCATVSNERLAAVKAKVPEGMVKNFSGDQLPIAWNRVALIPDRDLDHLIWTYNQRILEGIFPKTYFTPGVAGLTSLTQSRTQGGTVGLIATSITTAPTMAGFALQHEIGHAVEVRAREAAAKANIDFEAKLGALVSELRGHASITRSYARSNESEAWAEAYANYYCSTESQEFIKTNLPTTMQFLRQVLEPAQFESGSEPTGPTSKSLNPSGSSASSTASTTSTASGTAPDTGTATAAGGSTSTAGTAVSHAGADDIAIAIGKETGDAGGLQIHLASRLAIRRITICTGGNCTEQAQLATDASPLRSIHSGAERNLYPAKTVANADADLLSKEWLIQGYSADGQLLASRRIKFEKSSP